MVEREKAENKAVPKKGIQKKGRKPQTFQSLVVQQLSMTILLLMLILMYQEVILNKCQNVIVRLTMKTAFRKCTGLLGQLVACVIVFYYSLFYYVR